MNFDLIFSDAIKIIYNLDRDYLDIILISLQVSVSAIIISAALSVPLSYIIAINNFYFKGMINIIINTMLALPPVVVGLLLYILLSYNGVLGKLNILYSVSAMIIAQVILITPIIISLTIETFKKQNEKYCEYLISIHANSYYKMMTIITESRHEIIINLLIGFSRALSEVGAIIIVGGNIAHLTRTMTTGIVLETSKGELSTALSLGVTLIFLALLINLFLYYVKKI